MESLLEEYSVLKNRIKADTARVVILQAELESQLDPEVEIKKDYGTFKMVKAQSKWTYSEEVKKAEENLKILKTDEQEQGVAVESPVTYGLRFTPPKAQK